MSIDFASIKARHDCREVARRLGLSPKGRGRNVKVSCPVHDERTPSCSVSQSKWHCFGCLAHGDVFDLVCAVLCVETKEAIEWLGEGLELPPEPSRRVGYPPAEEVRDVLRQCGPCALDAHVSNYLRGRGLTPSQVDAVGGGYAFRPKGWLPDWAWRWPKEGRRMLCPLYDIKGTLRSLVARLTSQGESKSKGPWDYEKKALIFVSPLALSWLRGDAQPMRFVICEGEIDCMTWAIDQPEWATIGISSGAWTPDYTARIPQGATVSLATDFNRAGHTYARDLERELRARRARVIRWTQGRESA